MNISDYKKQENIDILDELPSEASFILPSEILKAKLPYASAAGPYGVSVAVLNKIALMFSVKNLHLRLLLGWMPSFILNSRTSFLPKKELSSFSSELRPISISRFLSQYLTPPSLPFNLFPVVLWTMRRHSTVFVMGQFLMLSRSGAPLPLFSTTLSLFFNNFISQLVAPTRGMW